MGILREDEHARTVLRRYEVGEIYNVFNHTQFSNVDSNAIFSANRVQTNNQFGRVNGARDPRTMQLALRLTF
jgi:hypothetical protein